MTGRSEGEAGYSPIAIIFDHFGPYHRVRLEAAASRLPVIPIEVREKTSEYAWAPLADSALLSRQTVLSADDPDSAPLIWQKLRTLLTELMPAAVAVPGWSSTASLGALHWCSRHRKPAIVMSESTAWDEPRRDLKERIKRRLINRCSAALVGGKPQVEYLQQLGMPPTRIQIGYDVVDNAYFDRGATLVRAKELELRKQLYLPKNYILASCRFIPKKNLRRLLDAYALYREDAASLDPMSLVILGDGPLEADLQRLISDLRLEAEVHLPGFKQYDELPGYYGLAAGFIHASTSEQWGLVVNEAMASGLPVLVSQRCGCVRDLVHDGKNGWTFDPEDVGDIARAIGELAKSFPERRLEMAEAGKAIISSYSPTAFAKGLEEAWRSAEKAPNPGFTLADNLLLRALALRNAL